MKRLDALLLRVAQWVVDKIGGDYLGQRVAMQINYISIATIVVLYLADYRYSGGRLTFLCVLWAILGFLAHDQAKRAMHDIHKGFANPWGGIYVGRIFNLALWFTYDGVWQFDLFKTGRVACYAFYIVALYLLATENPPPKQVKQTKEQDASLLNPSTNPIS